MEPDLAEVSGSASPYPEHELTVSAGATRVYPRPSKQEVVAVNAGGL